MPCTKRIYLEVSSYTVSSHCLPLHVLPIFKCGGIHKKKAKSGLRLSPLSFFLSFFPPRCSSCSRGNGGPTTASVELSCQTSRLTRRRVAVAAGANVRRSLNQFDACCALWLLAVSLSTLEHRARGFQLDKFLTRQSWRTGSGGVAFRFRSRWRAEEIMRV